ncbi:HEAT repeat domain-containing protein [Methanosarcina sp.]|uniref:HEAT repeat domain-containing protein n=1 Tax=Methanosarcina sp. TaxID=2213 RepID=UPI002ABCB2C5|nr:HEAT repeat domain-containing protein [Methanosarcina sp.]MDY9925565.1 HEAT repeat domain-containing protein [Methanosarcina sp.]
MSQVKWKISLLFALITLTIFFSLLLSGDKFIESNGNATNATAVAGVSSENQVTYLINRLETGDRETRLNSIAELGKFGKLAANVLIERIENVEPIEAGNSSSGEIKSYMLLALLETGDERAESTLSGNFEENGASNRTAADAAGKQSQGEVPKDIMQAIETKDKAMRESLARSLNMEYGNDTDILEEALKAEEQNSTLYTSFALSKIDPEEPGNETEKLLNALKSENGYVRVAAAMALGQEKEKAATDPLLKMLTRDYPLAKYSASMALGELGDEKAIDTLMMELKNNEKDYIRSSIAVSLGKLEAEEAVPYLIERLRDSKASVRSNAALTLGRMGNESAVEPLIDVLASGKEAEGRRKDNLNANADVRKSVVLALGGIGGPKATETLTGVLTDDGEMVEVRVAAASALGNIGSPEAVSTLKMVFDNQTMNMGIRNGALLALGKTKNQEAAGVFIKKLGDKDFGVSAREALINMGEPAVEPLIENLKTEDLKIKDETALILIEIGDPRAVEPLIQAYQ